VSVDRVWVWVCDHCKVTAVRHDYGLPVGWVFVKARVITHRCPECQDGLTARETGVPEVVASR
jgi:hypothetical protein